MSWYKFALGALLCATPSLAQITWVPSTSSPITNRVIANSLTQGVCRVTVGGNTYAGTAGPQNCYYIVDGSTLTTQNFELAVGAGKWDSSGLAGPATLGTINNLTTRVCRARVDGAYVVGYVLGNPGVCQMFAVAGYRTATKYEQLYDFNAVGEFEILQAGLCLRGDTTLAVPILLRACTPNAYDRWRLFPTASAAIKLENVLATGQCVTEGSFLSLEIGVFTACANAPSYLIEWFTDSSYRLRNPSSGEYLTRANSGLSTGVTVVSRPPTGSSAEAFEILTINEASRRLSVLSYNTMMLPDDQFPGLKQDERAEYIPQSLNRNGALADVIGFQEGFDASGRSALITKMFTDHQYLFVTGVPDWPSDVYASEILNPLTWISFGQFRSYTNGGAYIMSRWPSDRIATYRFVNNSRDGIFDTTGLDALAAKGVAYIRINKLGRRYHIFDTHLQAGAPSDESAVRQAQLQEFRNFVNITLIGASPEDGVVFTGDFNTDMETDVGNYNYILNTLNVSFVNAPRPVGISSASDFPRWTVDPDNNLLSYDRDSTKQWLDYVFVHNNFAKADRASYETFQFKHTSSYNISTAVLGIAARGISTTDLSDHGAVLARFTFAPTASVTAPPDLVKLTLRTESLGSQFNGQIQVNGGSIDVPSTFDVVRNVPLEIRAPEVLPGPTGFRYVFKDWDSQPNPFTLTPTVDGARYTAVYTSQSELKVVTNPPGAGTITGAGFYSRGAVVPVTATPARGFTFTGYTGPRNTIENPTNLQVNNPVTLTANFASTGAPRLSLLPEGPRTILPSGNTRINLRMVNSGDGGAVNARISNVVAVTVLTGGGNVSFAGGVTDFGTIAAGQNSPAILPLDFNWPESATRIRITLQLTADGGYSTLFTLTLFR